MERISNGTSVSLASAPPPSPKLAPKVHNMVRWTRPRTRPQMGRTWNGIWIGLGSPPPPFCSLLFAPQRPLPCIRSTCWISAPNLDRNLKLWRTRIGCRDELSVVCVKWWTLWLARRGNTARSAARIAQAQSSGRKESSCLCRRSSSPRRWSPRGSRCGIRFFCLPLLWILIFRRRGSGSWRWSSWGHRVVEPLCVCACSRRFAWNFC